MRKGHLARLSSVSLHSSTHRNGKLTPPPHLGLCCPIFLPSAEASAENSIYMVCMFPTQASSSRANRRSRTSYLPATPMPPLLIICSGHAGGTLCSWGGPPLMEMYPSVPHKDGGHSGRPPPPNPILGSLHFIRLFYGWIPKHLWPHYILVWCQLLARTCLGTQEMRR